MKMEEPDVAIVGSKGQIVIPQQLRKELNIKTKSRLAIYKTRDKLIVAKLRFPTLSKRLDILFREIDSQYKGKKRPTEREILKEIQEYRKEKRSRKSS